MQTYLKDPILSTDTICFFLPILKLLSVRNNCPVYCILLSVSWKSSVTCGGGWWCGAAWRGRRWGGHDRQTTEVLQWAQHRVSDWWCVNTQSIGLIHYTQTHTDLRLESVM